MAKKRKAAVAEVIEAGKVGLQVRLDGRVHKRLAEMADKLGVSLNRLLSDICSACSGVMLEGRLIRNDYAWQLDAKPGEVSFGIEGNVDWGMTLEERMERAAEGEDVAPTRVREGQRWFFLDYTENANIHGVER